MSEALGLLLFPVTHPPSPSRGRARAGRLHHIPGTTGKQHLMPRHRLMGTVGAVPSSRAHHIPPNEGRAAGWVLPGFARDRAAGAQRGRFAAGVPPPCSGQRCLGDPGLRPSFGSSRVFPCSRRWVLQRAQAKAAKAKTFSHVHRLWAPPAPGVVSDAGRRCKCLFCRNPKIQPFPLGVLGEVLTPLTREEDTGRAVPPRSHHR